MRKTLLLTPTVVSIALGCEVRPGYPCDPFFFRLPVGKSACLLTPTVVSIALGCAVRPGYPCDPFFFRLPVGKSACLLS